MLSDVQAWVEGSQDNFGWILIGEEWITEDQQVTRPDNGKLANASSKIDFFSSETAAPYYAPPLLTVSYHVVPEPSSIVLLVMGLGLFWWRWRRHWWESFPQRARFVPPQDFDHGAPIPSGHSKAVSTSDRGRPPKVWPSYPRIPSGEPQAGALCVWLTRRTERFLRTMAEVRPRTD